MTDEEFDTGGLPEMLMKNKYKLYGLTIAPTRLQKIRKERRALGKYSSAQQVRYELREAEKLFKKYGSPYVDTTEFSIEEISSAVCQPPLRIVTKRYLLIYRNNKTIVYY